MPLACPAPPTGERGTLTRGPGPCTGAIQTTAMPTQSNTYTAEFRDEYEVERTRMLRRRFLWYCGVTIGLSVLGMLVGAVGGAIGASKEVVLGILSLPAMYIPLIAGGISLLLFTSAFARVYRKPLPQDQLLRVVFGLIVVTGVLQLLSTPLGNIYRPDLAIPGAVKAQVAQAPPSEATAKEPDEDSPEQVEVAEPEAPSKPVKRESNEKIQIGGVKLVKRSDGWLTVKYPDPLGMLAVILGTGATSLFMRHFFASLFLPWTWKESLKPVSILYGLQVVLIIIYTINALPSGVDAGADGGAKAELPRWGVLAIGGGAIVGTPLLLVPGLLICLWRNSRFRNKVHFNVLKGRYSEIKRELVDARRIHESLFPAPISDGPVRLQYRYEPMRQIGGDYLYCKKILKPGTPGSDSALHVVIVDVTGHGITAALTVNRLHGEIDRQLGEKPDATPGDVLEGLNNYLHHTLASHSVYATALCLRVNAERDELTWASAGHPPAYLLTIDGRMDQLDSTTLVLGACRGDDFQHNERTMPFHRGDVLIAYTDGAIECRNEQGKMLGLTGFQKMVASMSPSRGGGEGPVGKGIDSLLNDVDSYRSGPIQDDTLLVEVRRAL